MLAINAQSNNVYANAEHGKILLGLLLLLAYLKEFFCVKVCTITAVY